MKKTYTYLLLGAIALFVISGCKRTKDTFTSRSYHNLVSKFNPLFNGEQALLKAENTIKLQHKDNFDEILPVFKLGDEQLISNVKPDLEKAIEKGSKVIQTHSMLIKNKQKNRFIDDCYILIGKARFYGRDYLKALETFNYVILEYPKGESVHEANMWAAKCKTELNNFLSAKEDFELIYREKEVPKKLKAEIFASYAQLEINQKRYKPAYQLLQQAIDKSRNKQQKIRWLFICGQLQAKMGNDFEASEIFRQVIKKGPPYEILFQAQLNRARNFDVELHDPDKAFDELKDMLRDDKNFDNRDQIYYAMAEIAEKLGEEGLMEDYLKKSVKAVTVNNKQKALSYLKLAEYNFTNRQYVTAEAYFDSTFKSLDPTDPRYTKIEKRKASLSELVKNLNIISTQDSLQKLASMSEEDRIASIEEHIEKLKEEEEAKKAAEAQPAFNNFNNGTGNTGAGFGGGPGVPGGQKAQWYFYNANLRAVGERDFGNKFGNRKLEDNWRRKNKISEANFAISTQEELDSAQGLDPDEGEDGKYAIENFTKNIPLTPEALESSNNKIIKAFQSAGRIYKDELSDLDAAVEAFEDLLGRFTEFSEKTRTWYSLYRIFVTKENEAKATQYKNLILNEAPDSEYASLIRNAGKEGAPSESTVAEQDYLVAYSHYEEEKFSTCLKQSEAGMLSHKGSDFHPKFQLLKAFALARLGKKDDFIANLKILIDEHGGTEEATEAQVILSQLELEADGGDIEEEEGDKTPYELKKSAQHKYVVVVPNSGGTANQLRIKITDFNKKFFGIDRLKTKSILMGRDHQIITVSNFKNSARAMDFYRNIKAQKVLDPYLKGPKHQHFVISSDNFPKFYSTQKINEYMEYFEKNYL